MNNPEGIKALVATAGGHLSHEEVANRVRMLMRTDLDHEAVCTMARDRIKWLAARVAELESLTAVAGDAEVVAWQMRRTSTVTHDWLDWVDCDAETHRAIQAGEYSTNPDIAYDSRALAPINSTRQAVEGMVLREVPSVIREMREWLMHAERPDGTQTIAHADVAVRDWERRLGTALMTDAGVISLAEFAGIQVVHNPTLPPDGFVLVPRDEAERLVKVLRYAAHPQPSPHGDYLAGLLAAAAPQAGKGDAS